MHCFEVFFPCTVYVWKEKLQLVNLKSKPVSKQTKRNFQLWSHTDILVNLTSHLTSKQNSGENRFPSRMPCHLTRTSQPRNSSVEDIEYFRSDFITTCNLPSFQCFDRYEDFGCTDGIFLCDPECTSCPMPR